MISKLNSLTGIAGAVLVAVALTAHPAAAQTVSERVKVAFTYHPEDPAEKIYSHLQSAARDACTVHGSRSLRLDLYERACTRELLDRAVAGIGRPDLAQLNDANLATYVANDAANTSTPLARTTR
jgi:UrcA family protein